MRIIFYANSVTNEHARVPGGPSQEQPSHVNLGEDEADSGCGGSPEYVTPTVGKGGKKRALPYSPSPMPSKKTDDSSSRINRILDLVEAEHSKNSVTSTSQVTCDPVRQEIGEMLDLVTQDGVDEGSDEFFYATQLFMKKECRDVFKFLKTPKERLAWLKRTWDEKTKR